MWRLSASSARRWSRRNSVVTSGDKTAVDIRLLIDGSRKPDLRTRKTGGRRTPVLGTNDESAPAAQNRKARELLPGFDLQRFLGCFCCYPNSWTGSAGTISVLMQQQAQVQRFRGNTAPGLYLRIALA